jgi:hypothetical protein
LKKLFLAGLELPPDVQIVKINRSYELCGKRSHGEFGIWLVLSSESFPELKPGADIPKLCEAYARYEDPPFRSARR